MDQEHELTQQEKDVQALHNSIANVVSNYGFGQALYTLLEATEHNAKENRCAGCKATYSTIVKGLRQLLITWQRHKRCG